MKDRDSIVDDLHKLRERIGRVHGFDVERIAATIRQHEREAAGEGRVVVGAPIPPKRRAQPRRRRAAQHRDGAVGA